MFKNNSDLDYFEWELILHTDQLMPPLEIGKNWIERFEEKEIDHAEGDRRINEGKEVVVEKEWQQFWNAAVTDVQLTLGMSFIPCMSL